MVKQDANAGPEKRIRVDITPIDASQYYSGYFQENPENLIGCKFYAKEGSTDDLVLTRANYKHFIRSLANKTFIDKFSSFEYSKPCNN